MRSWTVQEMLAEGPCSEYTEARLTKLGAGRHRLTLLEILKLDIPVAHKVWCICRAGALTEEQSEAWLEGIVTRAITNHVIGCGIPEAEEWGPKWLSGEDRSQYTAQNAAQNAAWRNVAWRNTATAAAAAAAAARNAAWRNKAAAAAAPVVWNAVVATRNTAWRNKAVTAAAKAAATVAARDAEVEQQMQDCIEILKGN